LSSTTISPKAFYYAISAGTRNSLKDMIQTHLKSILSPENLKSMGKNIGISIAMGILECVIRDACGIGLVPDSPAEAWKDYGITLIMANAQAVMEGGTILNFIAANAGVAWSEIKLAAEIRQRYLETLDNLQDSAAQSLVDYALMAEMHEAELAKSTPNPERIAYFDRSLADYQMIFHDPEVLKAMGIGSIMQLQPEIKDLAANYLAIASSMMFHLTSGDTQRALMELEDLKTRRDAYNEVYFGEPFNDMYQIIENTVAAQLTMLASAAN
jgi:hypothetical protein